MNQELAESVQSQVRVGKAQDLYYISEDEARKQAFPTHEQTRFVQDLTNKGQGSSTFIIPPNNGIQQVVVVLGWNAGTVGAGSGLALSQGWGYLGAIKQVSVRYGGSSQYFFTGAQLLQRSLRQSPSTSFANDILSLGGNAVLSDADWAQDQFAYCLINLPHSMASPEGETTDVLPSDLLTQQIQVTLELNPPSAYFSNNGAGAPPAAFDIGFFQVKQVILNNQGDALARRVDMNVSAYSMPLPSFDQQEVQISLGANGNTLNDIPITATGFRSGEVRSIQLYLTRAGDTAGATKNLNSWYLPKKVEMLYAGEVIQRFENGSSALWNLVTGRLAPRVNTTTLSYSAPNYTAANSQMYWVELDFAQSHIQESTTNVLVHGRAITNGIVNFNIKVPSMAEDWIVHLVYVYNSTLLFSKGTCDYVF